MPDKKDKLKKSSQGGSSKKTSQGDSSKKPTMPVGRQLYAVTVDKQKEDACNFLKTIPDKNLTDIMSKRPGTLYSANEKLDRSWTPGVRQTTGHRVDLQGFTRSGANLQLQWNGHEHMGKTTLAGMITDGSRAPGAIRSEFQHRVHQPPVDSRGNQVMPPFIMRDGTPLKDNYGRPWSNEDAPDKAREHKYSDSYRRH